MQLSSSHQSTMELRATGCKNSSESQVEQLFLTLSYRQIPLHLLHLQLLGKIQTYMEIKIVNFGNSKVNLKVSIDGLGLSSRLSGSTKTVFTSSNVMDENFFVDPKKVVPAQTLIGNADKDMDVVLSPYS
ncbi:PREDICTED: alpha-L-arabinofuranosidase 1-like isoform X2 [Populus euphratica]|uniref:Alpha-L-arabinofuranosidase 1-like isoform X2 n=1 Tax=Populus euphratica TaxID=75702 RepID=A0AAJ6TN03_POPEU|nr:PREDICTED: alpha-L-arabinofuranosidase 1-like isoform X2 [Populus euphratica]